MTQTSDPDDKSEPRKVSPLMIATWEAATSDPDPLAALGATRALVGLLSTWESQLAGEAVAAGATWESIGGSVASTPRHSQLAGGQAVDHGGSTLPCSSRQSARKDPASSADKPRASAAAAPP